MFFKILFYNYLVYIYDLSTYKILQIKYIIKVFVNILLISYS